MNWLEDLMDCAGQDAHYQSCLKEMQQVEPAFLALLEILPKEQRQVVENYFSACEELDHALLLLAIGMLRK